MTASFYGAVSGALIVASAIPYINTAIRGKNELHPVSWSLWALIGLALVVTYKSSGAEENFYAILASFGNTCAVLLIIFIRSYKKGQRFHLKDLKKIWRNLKKVEKACVILGLTALCMWVPIHTHKTWVQFALYLAIFADICAAIPTLKLLWQDPGRDKPVAWGLFTLGNIAALGAVTEHTFANYSVLVYMITVYGWVTIVTARHLIKIRAPLREWLWDTGKGSH